MLKTLKTQSRKKILLKIKVRDFFKYRLWQHLLVVAFALGCALLFDKILEMVLFCIAHIVIRKRFDKQYHCGTTMMCLVVTGCVLFFGISVVLPVSVSLLSAVPVCCFICFTGYLAQDRMDLFKYKQEKSEFDLETCTEKQVLERCYLLHYNEEKARLAVMFFVEKKSASQMMEYLDTHGRSMDIDSVYQCKKRIKKDLSRFITKKPLS